MYQIELKIFPNADEAVAQGFNYNKWGTMPTPVEVKQAVIVKNGTVEGRATVDIISEDKHGNKYVFMITAALLEMIVRAAQ